MTARPDPIFVPSEPTCEDIDAERRQDMQRERIRERTAEAARKKQAENLAKNTLIAEACRRDPQNSIEFEQHSMLGWNTHDGVSEP